VLKDTDVIPKRFKMDRKLAMELYESGSTRYRRIYMLWNGCSGDSMEGFHIHHKDNDHSNNRPDNLEKLTVEQHAKKHEEYTEFIRMQPIAVKKAAHPDVRARVAAKITGEGNGSFGKTLRSRFSTEGAFEDFCIKHRRGENNSQYGNVGRISGDKNPMKKLTDEQKALWLEKLSNREFTEEHLSNIRSAAKRPERRAKISERMQGNTSNQKSKQIILSMTESEIEEHCIGKSQCYITKVSYWRNPELRPTRQKRSEMVHLTDVQKQKRLEDRILAMTDEQFQAKIAKIASKYYVIKLNAIRSGITA